MSDPGLLPLAHRADWSTLRDLPDGVYALPTLDLCVKIMGRNLHWKQYDSRQSFRHRAVCDPPTRTYAVRRSSSGHTQLRRRYFWPCCSAFHEVWEEQKLPPSSSAASTPGSSQ